MRLSEAIRLGAISCKWGQCSIVDSQGNRCAFGMAAFAIGDMRNGVEVVDNWRWTNEMVPLHAAVRKISGDSDPMPINGQIMCLNDSMTLTPLQIADWVEGLERERGMWDEEVVQVEQGEAVEVR